MDNDTAEVAAVVEFVASLPAAYTAPVAPCTPARSTSITRRAAWLDRPLEDFERAHRARWQRHEEADDARD